MRNLEDLHVGNDWATFLSFRERKLQGIQTGLLRVDKVLLGLGGLNIIQGAPGANKSTLALQIAFHNASQGMPVLIIDRENGRERFRMRLLCQANNVSQNDILSCTKDQLRGYVERVMELPIYVCTDPVRDFEEIKAALSTIQQQYPGKHMLMIVDSLQALPHIDVDERMSIQRWLGHFDQAKLDWEGKLTQIVTSEKKRGQDEYDKSSLSAGKGSNSIEYKAELVFDIRRNRETGGLLLDVIKNRDGASGVSFKLNPVLSDSTNPQSFTFKLDCAFSTGDL